MKQNQQNSQNPRKIIGGTQPGCRRKAGLLAAFPSKKTSFEGFAGFVK